MSRVTEGKARGGNHAAALDIVEHLATVGKAEKQRDCIIIFDTNILSELSKNA
jgi:hypothetical protein